MTQGESKWRVLRRPVGIALWSALCFFSGLEYRERMPPPVVAPDLHCEATLLHAGKLSYQCVEDPDATLACLTCGDGDKSK